MRRPDDEDIWDRDPADTRVGCILLVAYLTLIVLIVLAIVFDWRLP